jgi:hypothetical protein
MNADARFPQLRVALVLGIASAIATACLFPYLLALKPGVLALVPVHPAVLIAAQSLQAGVMYFLLAWAGLKLGAPLRLGAPWLHARLYGSPKPAASNWTAAIVLGAAAGALILAAIAGFGPPVEEPVARVPAAWKGLLATPYGAIAEETGMRAFVMTAAAWLLARGGPEVPRWRIFGIAIVFAALLFGAGHLPMAAQLAPLDAGVVARVIGYNAIGGLVFGWLYARYGLEHAMVAHGAADLVLHVVPAL